MGVFELAEKHYTFNIKEAEIFDGRLHDVRTHIRNDKLFTSARHTAHLVTKSYVRRLDQNRILENWR